MTQDDALQILKTGANVFLTGEPGSGKTYTLNQYIDYLKGHGVCPTITASTGIAATHVSGITIHSFLGLGSRKEFSVYDIEAIATTERIVKKVSKAKVLIIDEISMLSGSTLNAIDQILKSIHGNNDAFGGIQVVLVGDFFQLPPITNFNEEVNFAFQSSSFRNANFVTCYLEEQHRQSSGELLDILSAIRENNIKDIHRKILNNKIKDKLVINDDTKLFTHNKNVDAINLVELKKISGKTHTFKMTNKGKDSLVDALIRGCLSPEILDLKIGARVMCTKNNTQRGFVNGTIGTVVSFGYGNDYPIIQTKNGEEILIEPMTWQIEEDGKVKAEITQVPLRLAWAITVHKSQGMSLDSASIDLTNAFEYGQGYVALSRVKNINGLNLLGLGDKSLLVHPDVLNIDEYFKNESLKTEAYLITVPVADLQVLFDKFIIYIGGSLKNTGIVEKNRDTYTKTLELIKNNSNLEEIIRERDLKLGTIIDHIHVLYEKGDITMHEIVNIVPVKLMNDLKKVYKAFDECGTEKLSPVFEFLNKKISYDDLKLLRVLYNASYK